MNKAEFGDNFEKWDSLFKEYCTEFPWTIAKGICMVESALGLDRRVACGLANPNDIEGSRSQDGLSWGIMQLTLSAAGDFDPDVTPAFLNNPEYSVKIASQLLSRMYVHFDGQEEWVVKGYNEGMGNAYKERAGMIPGFSADYWKKYQECKAIL